MELESRKTGDTFPPIRPLNGISSDTVVIESMKSTSHTHTAFTFGHIQEIGKVGTEGLVFEKGSFGVRVCVEAFPVARATSQKWGPWVIGAVWGRCGEEHDMIHCIAWEFRELCQGIEDVLLFLPVRQDEGRGLWRGQGTGWVNGGEKRRIGGSRWLRREKVSGGIGMVKGETTGDEGVTEQGYGVE